MTLELVQGNTGPDLMAVLHERDTPTAVLDLTSAAQVYFQMRKPDDRRWTVNAAVEIVDPEAGQVRYEWGANDLGVVGTYQGQFKVIWLDAKIETTPDTFEIVVRRE